jgi:hypothetical protein
LREKKTQSSLETIPILFGCLKKKRAKKMVFYFKARPEAGDYTIFMGLDKHENEELIKYGFPEDIWYSFFFFYFYLQFLAISIQICNLFPSGSLIY